MSLQSRFIRKEARTGSYIHTYIDLGKVSSESVAVYEKIDSMLGLYAWKISHLCSLGICVAGFCHCCCVDLCHCQRNCQPLAGMYNHSFDCAILPIVCICIIQAFGIVVKLSDGILGITLLAWGNSIGGII